MNDWAKVHKQLVSSGFCGDITSVVFSFLDRKEYECIDLIDQTLDGYIYGMNDDSIYVHKNHPKFGEVVEITCPYSPVGFIFLRKATFKQVVLSLLSGLDVPKVESLSFDIKDRMDYEELCYEK
jgi:hypothetical protein